MEKQYSLALWGWAARWIAHIGVIKFIEENKLKINEIAWTSMWAIVWACFATWMSSKEMTKIIADINYLKLVDLNMKESIISGNKVYNMLQKIYWDRLIEETYIPLKIIATKLENWEKHIFSSGKIVDAVRASINLPTIFKPYEIDWNKYLDWWLHSNLPVLELEWEDIIAVSVVREKDKKTIKSENIIFWFKFKTSFWKYNYQILRRTISIIMKNNEDFSLQLAKNNWKNIILLSPDVWNYEYFDFMKYKEIIKKWFDEAKSKIK